MRATRSIVREHRETRHGCRAHARVLVAVEIAIARRGLVRRVPHVRADTVVINFNVVVVAVVVVARGDPAGAGSAAALEHAAEFVAERAWEADGERVRANASAPDGVFAAAGGAVGR